MSILKFFPFKTNDFGSEVLTRPNVNAYPKSIQAKFQSYFSNKEKFYFHNYDSIPRMIQIMEKDANILDKENEQLIFKYQFFSITLTLNNSIKDIDSIFEFRKNFIVHFELLNPNISTNLYCQLSETEWLIGIIHHYLNRNPEIKKTVFFDWERKFLIKNIETIDPESGMDRKNIKLIETYKRNLPFLISSYEKNLPEEIKWIDDFIGEINLKYTNAFFGHREHFTDKIIENYYVLKKMIAVFPKEEIRVIIQKNLAIYRKEFQTWLTNRINSFQAGLSDLELKANSLFEYESSIKFLMQLEKIFYPETIEEIISTQKKQKTVEPNSQKKIYTVHWALYYFYLQEAEIMERFDWMEGGKIKVIEGIVSDNLALGSSKNFQLLYNKMNNYKLRLTRKNIPNIKLAITLLSSYPKAIKKAQKEIEDIEKKPY